jgi:hypothetical protein
VQSKTTKEGFIAVLRSMFAGVIACATVLLLAPTACAETHALLVGVSGYPSLPETRRLRGPANDVQLLGETLRRAGVSASAIRILADGVPGSAGLPTRREILGSLKTLARKASTGDWVVLYLSGHGSQQPQPPGPHTHIEPDGLDEIFLPYDIGRWNGGKMVVENAIVDDEISAALDAFRKKGVHVWAIFDTCHAGDMAKGIVLGHDAPVTRYISPTTLGVPDLATNQAHHTAGQKSALAAHPRPVIDAPVVYYASQPDEPASEELLQDIFVDTRTRRYYGLFTWLIADELLKGNAGFRELSRRVADRYSARPYPTPLFEGNLDQLSPFVGNQTAAVQRMTLDRGAKDKNFWRSKSK